MRLLFLNRSMLVVLIISCVLRWSGTVYAAPGDIETIVGGGPADGSVATDVSVEPEGVFVDNAGNIYVADRVNNRVYKVDGVGQISTIAGDGTRGYFGDGGLAVNAQVHHPSDVFVDGAGNIYIADTDNHCIRKVDTAGIITTVAGDGLQGDSGDGGPATSAKLRHPNGVFVDATGNIYIAGRTNDRIRKVDTAGIITTVAGNGTGGYSGDGGVATSAQLNSPYDVFVDGVGNIYIADGINNRIRKVDTAGIINTVAGNGANGYSGDGGAATSAALGSPSGVFVDGVGNIYIADGINNRIRKVDTAGIITTVAGNGGFGYSGDGGAATNAQLNTAARVSVDNSGVIYIADRNNRRLRKVDGAGTISTIVGNGTAGYSGDGGAATSAQLSTPYGVAVDAAGNVYLADRSNHIVRKVDSSGAISTVAGSGGFGYSGDGGAATNAEMRYPHGVAVDGAGNIYIADVTNHSIRKVDSAGNISTVAGTGTDGYSGDGGAATSAELASPTGVSVDGSGNLYIADSNNHRVRKVDIAGNISTVVSTSKCTFRGV
jgi:trimeric autotransporter adhesin